MASESSVGQPAQTGPASPSETQIEKLVEVISRSQHNYRELIDNLDQAVFTLSIDGEIKVANRRLSEILGVSFPDLIGHSLSEFVETPSLEAARQSLSAFAARGSWSGIVQVQLRKDDDLRCFSVWLQAVAEEGGITDVIGWARDVTEQQEAEMRFTQFVESLSAGVFFSTAEGRLLHANPALVRMWGFDSLEELQKFNIRERYVDPCQREELVRATAESNSVQDRNIAYRRKDGSIMHGRASGVAIRDHYGRLVRFQGTIVDVTDRVEIERKLHREQEFNRRLIECFPDLVVVLDRDLRFTFVSERSKDVLGLPPETYIGKEMGAHVDSDGETQLGEMYRNIICGNQAHGQMEVRARHADGTLRTFRVSASPLFDENETITGIVSSAADVTESLQIEQQLALREKFAAMGEMLTGAAHELNNPLTAILGVSDLLRENASDPATRRRTELILQQARRAASIVQTLLAFSRPSVQPRSKVVVADLVRKAVQGQQTALDRKNIRVKVDVADDLPQVDGDPRLLTQVFTNIITNAEQSISAARDSGGSLAISLSRQDHSIRISFDDDGSGIAPENIGRLFDPFFTTRRPGGSSGLGLTICLAVVKDHGGTIEVLSAPNAGATFHVMLPFAPGSAPLAAPSPAEGDAATVGGLLEGHTVLIVDDEEAIREIVGEGLLARGMTVHTAESSEAALSYLAANPCEIIVCDFNLPGLRGEEFSKRVLEQGLNPPPRFVFMTGELLDAESFERFRKEGARLLQKPFQVSALADLVAELLQPQPAPAA